MMRQTVRHACTSHGHRRWQAEHDTSPPWGGGGAVGATPTTDTLSHRATCWPMSHAHARAHAHGYVHTPKGRPSWHDNACMLLQELSPAHNTTIASFTGPAPGPPPLLASPCLAAAAPGARRARRLEARPAACCGHRGGRPDGVPLACQPDAAAGGSGLRLPAWQQG